ncbi:uncharacterized protein [Ptychodera flava]
MLMMDRTMSFVLITIFMVAHLEHVSATADLKAEFFTITNKAVPLYMPGKETPIELTLVVKNVGTMGLHSGDSPKFYADAYFADSVEEENAHQFSERFNLTIPNNQAAQAFAVSQKVNLTGLTVTMNEDKDHCFHYDHLCVDIFPTHQYKETDDIINNDFCLILGNAPPGGAGHLHCTDLKIKDFKLNNPDKVTYKAGEQTSISFSVDVQNVGPVDLPAMKNTTMGDHFGFELFFEGAGGTQGLGSPTIVNHGLTRTALNGKDNPTAASNTVNVPEIVHTVTIDEQKCKEFEELCLRLVPNLSAKSVEDDDEDICVPLTETGAGVKDCTIDVIVEVTDKPVNPQAEGGVTMVTVSTAALFFCLSIAVLF